MKHFYFIFLFVFILLKNSSSQEKIPLLGQDSAYQLYSTIDTSKLEPFKDIFVWGKLKLEMFDSLRMFLLPYLEKDDPLAIMLYAKTYDLGPYGYCNAEKDSIAMQYYQKLVEMKHANTELLLHKAYKYGDLHLEINYKKSLDLLDSAIKHGDYETKAYGYFEYAHIYYDRKNKYKIKANRRKTIEFLEKTLQYDSTHTMAIDFLAGLYKEKGGMHLKKAFDLMLKSNNMESNLEAATWMMEGKHVEKDFQRGLSIVIEAAREIKRAYPYVFDYMGSRNPVLMMNDLYKEGKIERDEVKEFYIENY